jgi:hypothetical protein
LLGECARATDGEEYDEAVVWLLVQVQPSEAVVLAFGDQLSDAVYRLSERARWCGGGGVERRCGACGRAATGPMQYIVVDLF